MRSWIIAWTCLVVLAGCGDPEAANRAEARKNLTVAINHAREARQGYSPNASVDWPAYRSDRIDQTINALAPLASGNALSADEQAAAQRWLADMYQARARIQLRHAARAWAQTARSIDAALDLLVAADRAKARAGRFDVDQSALVASLEKQIDDQTRQMEAQTKAVAELKGQIAELDQQLESLSARQDEAVQEAGQLRRDAFTETGMAQSDLNRQAVLADRRAGEVERDMQGLLLRRGLLESELSIEDSRLTTARSILDMVRAQLAATNDHISSLATGRDESAARQAEHVKQLYDRTFPELHQKFTAALEAYAAADADAAQSVQAALAARGGQEARLNLLAAYMARLNTLTQQIVVAGSYARTLDLMAAMSEQTAPDRAGLVHEAAAGVKQTQAERVGEFMAVIQEAREVADALTEGSEEVSATAQKYREYFDAYQQRVNEAALVPPAEAVEPAPVGRPEINPEPAADEN